MPWLRVDEGFHSHPKVLEVPNSALGLWLRCATWSAQHLTDGAIPARIWRKFGRKRDAEILVSGGLWARDGDGFVMHDYLDYNPSASEVKLRRKQELEAQRAGGRKRAASAFRNVDGTFR